MKASGVSDLRPICVRRIVQSYRVVKVVVLIIVVDNEVLVKDYIHIFMIIMLNFSQDNIISSVNIVFVGIFVG